MAEITVRRWLCRSGLAAISAVVLATTSSAQAVEASARMPEWDASGSVALRFIRASDLDGSQEDGYDNWEPQWEPGGQVGRYLTSKLKVQLGVRGPMQYGSYETEFVPAPAVRGGLAPTSVERQVRVLCLAPAVTWQFFDNTFVHPYVSAGVAIDVLDIHRLRQAGTGRDFSSRTAIQYDIPGIDTRETDVKARPFLAAGTKSYFSNGRWFVRPEIEAGFTKSRLGAVSLRLGIGVDF